MSRDAAEGGRTTAGALETMAFLCELAMLAALVVAGLGLGRGTATHVALAVALPVLAVLVWARWMAPTSSSRLADPARLIVQVALFTATGVLAVLAGHPVVGIGFAIVAIVAFTATRRTGGEPGTTAPSARSGVGGG